MAETTLFMENFYILDDGRVRQFLITGESGQSSIMKTRHKVRSVKML